MIGTIPPLPPQELGIRSRSKRFLRKAKLAWQMRREFKMNESLSTNTSTGGDLERKIALGIQKTRIMFLNYAPDSIARKSCTLFIESAKAQTFGSQWLKLMGSGMRIIEVDESHNEIVSDRSGVISNEIGRILQSA